MKTLGQMRIGIVCSIVTAALVSACGVTEPPEGFSVAWMVNGCSPVDGPAVDLFLGEVVPVDVSSPTYPHLRISIDASVEALSGNLFTSQDNSASIFVAQRCVVGNECTSATDVTVEFDVAEDSAVEHTGYVQVTLSDGSSIEGSFRATVHSLLVLCG